MGELFKKLSLLLGTAGVVLVVVVVAGAAVPANTSPPTIDNTSPVVGDVLTGGDGVWDVNPAETAPRTYAWVRCDPGCNTPVGGGSTYTVQSGDKGNNLVFRVTVTNADGQISADSAQTAAVREAPSNTSAPGITGTAAVGQTLTYSAGAWSGAPVPTVTWQWCTPGCGTVLQSSGGTYTVQPGDVGQQVIVRETASNTAGSATKDSAATAAVPAVPPVNTVAPSVNDSTPTVGQAVTYTAGTWTGTPSPTVTVQWCTPGCAVVLQAGGASYTVQAGDVGRQIIVRETANNGTGAVTKDSAPTSAVPPVPPANATPPAITGTVAVGQVLTRSAGSWTGAPPPTVTWQWCYAGDCSSPLAGNTATYTVQTGDVGKQIIVRETANNGTGPVTKDSAATIAVPPVPPVNATLPGIAGSAVVGQTLTRTAGAWTGTPAPTVTWQWCTTTAPICGAGSLLATGSATYVVKAADVGQQIIVRETASNTGGAVSADSTPSSTVTGPPVNTVVPSIDDLVPDRGQTLTASSGTWIAYPGPGPTPVTLTHQWFRCNLAGTTCSTVGSPITTTVATTPPATQTSTSQYVVTDDDLGSRLKVRVTASNGVGPAIVVESPLTQQAQGPPVNVPGQLPAVSGSLLRGQMLTATSGQWTGFWPGPAGTQPVAFTHTWQRCPADTPSAGPFDNCVPVSPAPVAVPPNGAVTCTALASCGGTSTYVLSDADLGSRIRVTVTATNGGGTVGPVATALTDVVQGAPIILQGSGGPDPNALPKINGIAQAGFNIGASSGSWSAFPLVDATTGYAYQWLRCSGTDVGSCSPIGGATSPIYGVQDADVGQRLRVRVTAANTVGAGVANSDPTGPVAARTGGGGDGVDLLLSVKATSSGGRLTYTLTVTNAGSKGASGVTVNAVTPSGVRLVSANAAGGCSGSGPVACAIGGLAPGANGSATIVVEASQTGVVQFSATASSAEADVNTSNNSVSLSTFLVVVGSSPQGGTGTGGGGKTTVGTTVGIAKTIAIGDVKLKARRVGKTWVLATTFTLVSGKGRLQLTVSKNGSSVPLGLLKGSKLGTSVAAATKTQLTLSTSKPATFPIKIVLPAKGFSLTQIYVVHITATAATGASSALDLGFKGATLVTKRASAKRVGKTVVASSTLALPGGANTVRAWVSLAAGTKKLVLLKGSRLGTFVAGSGGSQLTAKAAKGGIVPVKILLAPGTVSRQKAYVIRVQAASASGIWTDYEIRFAGVSA